MNWIIEKAEDLYKKYRSADLDVITSKLKAEIIETPLLDEIQLKEVYFPDLKTIAIASNLSLSQKRYLISHALGHHLFHRRNGVGYIHLRQRGLWGSKTIGEMEIGRKEREADVFASYFLIPKEKLNPILAEDWFAESANPIADLAEQFQVPEELVRKRLEFKDDLGGGLKRSR
jgi:Zn-dependent peptidase ImmA (M78 family)